MCSSYKKGQASLRQDTIIHLFYGSKPSYFKSNIFQLLQCGSRKLTNPLTNGSLTDFRLKQFVSKIAIF